MSSVIKILEPLSTTTKPLILPDFELTEYVSESSAVLTSYALDNVYLFISSPPLPPRYIIVPSELNCIFLGSFSSEVRSGELTLLPAVVTSHGVVKVY